MKGIGLIYCTYWVICSSCYLATGSNPDGSSDALGTRSNRLRRSKWIYEPDGTNTSKEYATEDEVKRDS